MNARPLFSRAPAASLALAALLLGGCWKDRLVWSPDGRRAAVITTDGLHLCEADGKLSPLLAPGVYRAAWLADSQRLVLARQQTIKDFAALAAALGPDRTKALATKAEVVWQQFLASPKGEFDSPNLLDDDLGAIALYLREHHGAALRAKIAQKENSEKDLAELDSMAANWHSLVVAQLVGDRLEIGATLSEGLVEIQTIRPAPGGAAVAFVAHLELIPVPDDGLRILLSPLDGSSPAVLVASHTAAHPDWTPDGRTLVYLKAAGEHSPANELQLGALVERDVLDATGHIQLGEKTRDLAGLIFQDQNRVRCLRDGRVLFDAAEFHLPLAGHDQNTREQLFALDRTKETAALTPLIPHDQLEHAPNSLALFEVSPDEAQVLLAGDNDAVHLLTLSTGAVERIPLELVNSTGEVNPPLPVWRRPGEFTYLKRGKPLNQLILRRGSAETVLSTSWPAETMQRLIQ